MTDHRQRQGLTGIVQLAGGALVVAAIVQELRKPAETRTWHGRVAGFVPYLIAAQDLRLSRECC